MASRRAFTSFLLQEGIGNLFDAVGGANEDDGGAATDDQAQITSLLRQLERIVRIPNVLRRPVQYLRPRTEREES